MDNSTTYYKLLQVSKVFKLDTDIMKARFIKKVETSGGSIHYRLPNNWLHSCGDQPAIVDEGGGQHWYIDDELHRDNDKPAVVYANGTQHWFINGNKHRDNDQPATIYSNGTKYWFVDGNRHRDNGKPAMMSANGTQCWYINDKLVN